MVRVTFLALLVLLQAGDGHDDLAVEVAPGRTRARVVSSSELGHRPEPRAEVPAPVPLCGPARKPPCFEEAPLSIPPTTLFDMGVADADGDGDLDVFTTGCSYPNVVLLSDGHGGFTDGLASLGLSHSPELPGLEIEMTSDRPVSPGVHVGRTFSGILVKSESAGGPVSGTIDAPARFRVRESSGCEATVDPADEADLLTPTHMEFRCAGDGYLELRTRFIALPYTIDLGATPPSRILVGGHDVHPEASRFRIQLQDRHGAAWLDVDGDGSPDLFQASGGLRGFIHRDPDVVRDRLYVRDGERFIDVAAARDLAKGECRARAVAWTDVDGDGRLDLHIGCEDSPDQVLRQRPDGCYEDVAAPLSLPTAPRAHALWIDADGDGRLDLLRSDVDGGWLYLNRYPATRAVRLLERGPFSKLAAGDYDGDGDVDVYAASWQGSVLLQADGATFHASNPSVVGLPSIAFTASAVDFDNDGLLDLHTLPGGLFRQVARGRFEYVGGAMDPEPEFGRCSWADMDGDGARDLVLAASFDGAISARLYRNRGAGNHWLEVDLESGGRAAIGARATLYAGDLVQASFVGAAEGSHFSQGHYRLYFGLGKRDRVDLLRVVWPDGSLQDLTDLAVDRRLELSQP